MNAAIVCDTGPLIALCLVQRLPILHALYQQVWVPDAVLGEVLQGGTTGVGVSELRDAAWCMVAKPVKPPDPVWAALLDQGEAAVLALAQERQVRKILMDERKGRKVARTILGLEVIGTARLLVDAKAQGLIREVKEELAALTSRGYWLDEHIVEWAVRAAGEF